MRQYRAVAFNETGRAQAPLPANSLVSRSRWALSLDFDSTLNNDNGYDQSIGARLDVPF